MDNVYSQSEFERNSITELPDGFAERAGDVLYSWLGSLWRELHRGDDMVRGLQKARGMRLAQLYVDILEAAQLHDRNGAPVFHRELWHPIVLRKSNRDKAQENMLYVGMDAQLGEQPDGSEYGEGTILQIGRLANFEKYVTYPIESGIVGMAASVVDNIVKPEVSMQHDADFVFRNNTIIFRRENDPLAPGSPFEKYDIPTDDPDNPDVECVIWASDVLIDKNYVADHISYAIGADAPSTDVVKRIVNAAWSSIASGLTPELVKTLIAAMLNVPVIQKERETVVELYEERDGKGNLEATIVRTDMGTYRVSPRAELRRDVYAGAVLKKGDLLDESLRVYPFLNNVDVEVSKGESGEVSVEVVYDDTGFSVPLEEDIPSIVLPRDVLRVRTKYGLYAMWEGAEVKVGSDGNPNHLYFDVGGVDDDISAFWRDIWRRADAGGVKMADFLGAPGSIVSPAAFFLKHLIGANTLFIVIDMSQLDDASKVHDPMFFGMLTSAVPSAIRLFVVERRRVEDSADLGDAAERTFLAAALPREVERVPFRSFPEPEGRGPSFGDCAIARFVRPSPPKVKGRKEEE